MKPRKIDVFIASVQDSVRQILPTIENKHPQSQKKEIRGALEKILVGKVIWFTIAPFSGTDRQIFLHISPDIKIITRMVCVGGNWISAPPNMTHEPKDDIWNNR